MREPDDDEPLSVDEKYDKVMKFVRKDLPNFAEKHGPFLFVVSDNDRKFVLSCKKCGVYLKSTFTFGSWPISKDLAQAPPCELPVDDGINWHPVDDDVNWDLANMGRQLMEMAGTYPVLVLTIGDVRDVLDEDDEDCRERRTRPSDLVIEEALERMSRKHEFDWTEVVDYYVEWATECTGEDTDASKIRELLEAAEFGDKGA